ncbi:MAG: sugar phosphate isomerase/epimerase family protein, partial [Bryobacteraceae bacterium]
MRVGCFTPLLSQFPLEKVFEKLKKLGISTVELGTGNFPGDPHCKLSMLTNEKELKEFKKKIDDHGFSISALSTHGNPLHPDQAVARAYADTSKRTVELAAKLGIPVVIDFSGCPGDSDHAKYPNWVTCPWPPEYLDLLQWQWEAKVAPDWIEHGKFAKDHGVKIGIE